MQLRLHRGRQLLPLPEHRLPLLLLPVAVALVGCGGSEPRAEEPPPPEPVAEAPPAPDVDDLRALAAGSRDAIDAGRGVVFVVYASDPSDEDPRADEHGMIRTAARACGAALDAELERLAADIERRLDDEAWAAEVRCGGRSCSIPAMGEYDLSGSLTFEGGALVSVVRIEGGPVTEDFVTAGEEYAEARLAELAGGRCE